jgi:hypothetical protein
MVDTQIDYLSQVITALFAECGVNPPFIETILLHDGRYVGRKFKAGGYQVIWQAEKNAVELLDQDGQTARVVELEENFGKISA